MGRTDPAVDPLFLAFQLALAGRYSIDRELGRGGMGVVYLAREVHLDRSVAIKLLPPERAAHPQLRERFLREARLAAKLSHPNIIPIHAVDEAGGFVHYVMAYIDGVTLAERVRTRGPLSGSEGARVLREVAFALAYAHGQGVVHRDVKPDNILLEAASGRVLVADFGIAAATGEAGGDGIAGTPEFMSPEQALGGLIDDRSDLYGLGVTAFYAFSGRLPFEGATPTEVLARQVTAPPPPLGSLGLAVPRKLAALVDRCLAKDPAHRPASAQALAEQLGVALEQRRELPAALRAFVKRTGRIDGSGTLLYGMALAVGSTAVSGFLGASWGFATLAAGVTVTPFAYLVRAARRFIGQGFGHADLGPAFKAELDQGREERAVEQAGGPARMEKPLRLLARVAGVGAALAAGVAVLGSFLPLGGPDLVGTLVGVAALGWGTALISTIAHLSLAQRRRDIDGEFWSRVWLGRIGRMAFSIARRLPGTRQAGIAMTHRATELSLGMAAEQLYESLPRETRHALGDVPDLLRRLQADAQGLRTRYDALQEALAASGDAGLEDGEDLRAARDALHARLGEAVGALETIRLSLLRLHAGSMTVEGLTTHLGIAAEVSEEVERLIAAHDEVGQALRFPRELSTTPTG